MAASELPSEVQRLVNDVIASMDHVEVLLRVYKLENTAMTVDALAADTHIAPSLLSKVLHDLHAARLLAVSGGEIRYVASANDDAAVRGLIEMYNTRPVTLVRAVYARLSPVRTFADAFRLRRDD